MQVVEYNEKEKCNYQYITAIIDENVTKIDCDTLVKIFHAENVLVRRYFYPGCHQMEPYRSFFPHAKILLPNTEKYSRRVMSFPTGTSIAPEHIMVITSFLKYVMENAVPIHEALASK